MSGPLVSKTNVVLCGSNYAAFYIPSLQELNDSFELTGVLAAGSDRSTRLAARHKVPLWTSVPEVPHSVQAAIVALPPVASVGVATQLLRRGIHVLMEHPVRADRLAQLRAAALSSGAVHCVNCHFAELSSAQAFIDGCRQRRALEPPQWVSVVTAPRSAYSTFDVLGRALGALAEPSLERELTLSDTTEHPFESFRGLIDGTPVRVQCSREVGPVDDGSDSPVPQRVEVGFRGGSLILQSFAGPVIWLETFRTALKTSPTPLWRMYSPGVETFSQLIADRVRANSSTLQEFRLQIETGIQPIHQTTAWLTAASDLATAVRTRPPTLDLPAEE